MPELPEVETIVRELQNSDLIGKKICDLIIYWPRTIQDSDVANFRSNLIGQKITHVYRRGKYIVFTLGSGHALFIHLRMTGKFSISKDKNPISSHERLQVHLSNGQILHYEDQRKFGKWSVIPDPDTKLKLLGLEPLSTEFTLNAFKNVLKNSSQQIKPFLLNQQHVAGIGNIYADEALWEAEIHPARKVNSLSSSEIKALHAAIIKVLKQGVSLMGTSLGSKQANYYSVNGHRGDNQSKLNVFRREGSACPRCGQQVIKIKLAQRGTHLCPHCQIFESSRDKKKL